MPNTSQADIPKGTVRMFRNVKLLYVTKMPFFNISQADITRSTVLMFRDVKLFNVSKMSFLNLLKKWA